LPQRYAASLSLLPWLALGGLGYAWITVLATVLVALRLHRRGRLGLVVMVLLIAGGFAIGWRLGELPGLAVGGAVAALAATGALAVIAAPAMPAGLARSSGRYLALAGVAWGILELARPYPIAWLAVSAVFGLLALREPGQPGRHVAVRTITGNGSWRVWPARDGSIRSRRGGEPRRRPNDEHVHSDQLGRQ
jgi:hypothetical protein